MQKRLWWNVFKKITFFFTPWRKESGLFWDFHSSGINIFSSDAAFYSPVTNWTIKRLSFQNHFIYQNHFSMRSLEQKMGRKYSKWLNIGLISMIVNPLKITSLLLFLLIFLSGKINAGLLDQDCCHVCKYKTKLQRVWRYSKCFLKVAKALVGELGAEKES